MSPADGTSVDKARVIIKGAIDPNLRDLPIIIETSRPNSTEIDSSFPAHMNGEYFAALVPLNEGDNIIKAKVVDSNGVQRDVSITVNAEPEPETLILSYITPNVGIPTLKDNGLTTFDVRLEAANVIPSIEKHSWDFNGDGPVDLECGDLRIVTASYQTPGIYLPTVTITDTLGNTYTDTTIVNVLDKDNMDAMFKMIWNKMKAALARKDIEGGLNYFFDYQKERYRQAFSIIIDDLPQLVTNMQGIEMVYLVDNIAKYRISRVHDIDGTLQTITYYIYFAKDADGVWKIDRY